MSKFDNDDVIGLDCVDDVRKASFDGIRARAAATDGLVDNRKRK